MALRLASKNTSRWPISSVASRESDHQSQRSPDIRRVFADYHIESADMRYTVGGGTGSQAREVLIFSWDVEAEPAGLF